MLTSQAKRRRRIERRSIAPVVAALHSGQISPRAADVFLRLTPKKQAVELERRLSEANERERKNRLVADAIRTWRSAVDLVELGHRIGMRWFSLEVFSRNLKNVKTVFTARPRAKSKRSKHPEGKSPTGRLSKRTPLLEKQLLEIIRTGLPLKFACASVGVTFNAMDNWRRADPEFAQKVDLAIMASVRARWELIRKAGEDNERGRGDWKSQAWLLERCFPADFSRPEIQLGIAVQTNVNTSANGSHNFEAVVLTDLEFSKLRSNPSYQHRRNVGPVRDVEAEVIAPDLSGTLVRADHCGAVISQSQADETRRRVEKAEAKIEGLLPAKRNAGGNAQEGEPEASSGLVLAPIKMPEGEPPTAWWCQFVQGSNDRQVEKQTAIEVCKTILREVWGPLKSQRMPVDFKTEPVTLGDLQAKIAELTGPKGSSVLLKKAGRE
jgi:hypothetical protein